MGQQGFVVRNGKWIVIIGAIVVVLLVAWRIIGSRHSAMENRAQTATSGQNQLAVPGQVLATKQVPSCLAAMSGEGAAIYGMARAQNWQQVGGRLKALREAAKRLPVEVKKDAVDEPQLLHVINDLDHAAAKQDRLTTMRLANEVTFIAARLSAPFELQVPVEVSMLDYFGRELEIWSTAKDKTKLALTANEIRDAWRQLRPLAQKHGGDTQVQVLDGLVGKIQVAQTPEAFGQLAVPFLTQVDRVEKLFF